MMLRPLLPRLRWAAVLLMFLGVEGVQAQVIPDDLRGREQSIARGILDGNLIETNFRNHAEFSRWNDLPWGVWPRGIGGRHIDGVAMVVAGQVPGERTKWPEFFNATTDTTLNPVIITYREAGKTQGPTGALWGWLPLPGFHNPDRRSPITGDAEPTPALSDDPSSWPVFWPDRLDNPDDPGWRNDSVDDNPNVAAWNGLFGKGVFNADLETFYVVDDFSDRQYTINPLTGEPYDDKGIFYPDPADSTKGGFGLQAQIRALQWGNVLAEDVMFILYRITNAGGADHDRLYFTQFMDYGLGNEEGDENAAYDPQLDVVYGWDQDGLCQETVGTGTYNCGYTGFAFLESPADAFDGQDNDEDGITDESRFDGAGMLIEGQDEIRAAATAAYDLAAFEAFNGPLEERSAFVAGRWWTGDENLDWVGFEDANGNGVWEPGELLNDDLGRDGLGPFDLAYPGPDTGQGDGIPTKGEPNFDELDVDESDQIGLTGFDLNTRPFYENGNNLRTDTWMWDRIFNVAQFELGQEPEAFAADVEPFIVFSSGPVGLVPNQTDFFSTAWIFGVDEQDFFKNRRVVQNIYNADYNFAQAPLPPTLTAVPGDGKVTLSWDDISIRSFDRFCQNFDFEGFKLYRGTDPLLSDARTITDVDGTPTFYEPIAQWDLENGISGPVTVFDGEAIYDVGDDMGLNFYYVDEDVINGVTYYYALVAYDHGCGVWEFNDDGQATAFNGVQQGGVGPQENTFNVSVTLAGDVLGTSINAAVVTPRARAAGFIGGSTDADLSAPTQGIGTGSIAVNVVDEQAIDPTGIYRVSFFSTPDTNNASLYNTVAYTVEDISTSEVLLDSVAYSEISPLIDGFVIDFMNVNEVVINPALTGYVSNAGTANEFYSLDPTTLDGISTNWIADIRADSTGSAQLSAATYELRWVDPADSTYRPPRVIGFLRDPIPIFAVNTTTGQVADLLVNDRNSDDVFGVEDELIIVEDLTGTRTFRNRYRVTFTAADPSNPVAPSPGDVIQVSVTRPFATGDFFQFSLQTGMTDTELAASEMENISVVPNPYVGASIFERRSQVEGRGERVVQFINLPATCTIRIFNLRGELVRTLRHQGFADDGTASWDLLTDEGQDVAYGVYVYHVEAPGIGEKVGKLALIK